MPCSMVGRYFFLSKYDPIPSDNGAILIISTIIKAVMILTADVELSGLYINRCEPAYIRPIPEAMGHI